MNELYRNVICPWQRQKEIISQSRFIDKMIAGMEEETMTSLLRLNMPDHIWSPKDGFVWDRERSVVVIEEKIK